MKLLGLRPGHRDLTSPAAPGVPQPSSRPLAALAASLARLAYPARGQRDLRLDLLRGLAVVVMVVDHFLRFYSAGLTPA